MMATFDDGASAILDGTVENVPVTTHWSKVGAGEPKEATGDDQEATGTK
jgi:hypothetical protein